MRLIDAHDVLGKIEKMETVDVVDIVESIIMSQTVDAVPVIRCKDCRWYAYKYDGYHSECDLFKMCFDPDDYCSRAERNGE